ncbi:hypothetical protein BJY59DRAFT_254199 [Rhodotorula toruloides]
MKRLARRALQREADGASAAFDRLFQNERKQRGSASSGADGRELASCGFDREVPLACEKRMRPNEIIETGFNAGYLAQILMSSSTRPLTQSNAGSPSRRTRSNGCLCRGDGAKRRREGSAATQMLAARRSVTDGIGKVKRVDGAEARTDRGDLLRPDKADEGRRTLLSMAHSSVQSLFSLAEDLGSSGRRRCDAMILFMLDGRCDEQG